MVLFMPLVATTKAYGTETDFPGREAIAVLLLSISLHSERAEGTVEFALISGTVLAWAGLASLLAI